MLLLPKNFLLGECVGRKEGGVNIVAKTGVESQKFKLN